MNKTVTVNIGGMVFHIEEQAYEQLKKYLDSIRIQFTAMDGRDEILQDIEARFAELFNENINDARQVVTAANVESAIRIMGKPEELSGNEEDDHKSSRNENFANKGFKRLYRDGDDKVIGGVCSGLGHYIGIDPVWLRLIFAAAFFIGGTGLLLYFILLIIIPKARTTTEKLEMKGQAINVQSIKAAIEEEVTDIKARFSGESSNRRSGRSAISNFFDAIGAIIVAALKFFVSFISAVFAVVLFTMLLSLFIALLAMAGLFSFASLPIFMSKFFLETWQLNIGIISLGIVIGIPLLLLVYRLMRSFLKFPKPGSLFNRSALIIWVLGLALIIFTALSIENQFSVHEDYRTNIPITQPSGDTLCISLNGHDDEEITVDSNPTGGSVIRVSGKDMIIKSDADCVLIGRVELDIIRSNSDFFELIQVNSAYGNSGQLAVKNAKALQYNITQKENEIYLSDVYGLSKGTLFRGQKVKLLLKVPEGKSVYLGDETGKIIYDVKNVSNTLDEEMAGKTWTMTPKGLQCIGCALDEVSDTGKENEDVEILINGKNADEIQMNDSIEIKNENVKIKIGSDGIKINTNGK